MRSIPNCFRRLHLSVEAYRRSRPYESSLPSQYNASCAGKEIKERLRGAQASFDFTVAVGQALKWFMGAKKLKLQTRIFFFRRDSPTAAATLWPQRGMKTGVSRR